MTILDIVLTTLRNARIRRQSESLADALAPTPLHEDAAITWSEAEYWLELCLWKHASPLINDPKARQMLADAAKLHEPTGLGSRLYRFHDDSKLLISRVVEMVL